jgi:hypothetical protein
MDDVMIQPGAGQQNLPTPDVAEMLTDLVKACEGDPFLIQSQFAELIAAMPAALQLSLWTDLCLPTILVCARPLSGGFLQNLRSPRLSPP